MTKYIQDITLDVFRVNWVTISAKQYDNCSNVVRIRITANGIQLKPDEGVTAIFRMRKDDGHSIYSPAEIDGEGRVVVSLTRQALARPGVQPADVSLKNEKNVISTMTFYIQVNPAPLGDNLDSKDELLVLEKATARADEASQLLEGMTVSATKIDAGGTPTASLTKVDGHYALALGLVTGDKGGKGDTGKQGPKGDKGDPGGVTSVNGKTGVVNVTSEDVGALPLTGGTLTGPLNVGDKVQVRTDAEGGNIRITSPDGTFYAEMDAYNNAAFRIYTSLKGKNFQALILGKDAESTSIHGTADKVAHALSFSGGETGSYDGSAAKTVKIPNTADEVSALPSCVSIPSNADLNDYTKEGIYGCTTNAIASTIKHSPTSVSFALLVIPRGKGGNVVQLLVNSSGTICTRSALTSGWSAWVKATSETVSSDPGAVDGPSAFDQLRADVDYIAAMQGVEL